MTVNSLNHSLKAYRRITSALSDRVRSLPSRIHRLAQGGVEASYGTWLRHRSLPKQELIEQIGEAVQKRRGFATGKLGLSQKHWMYYEVLLRKKRDAEEVRQFEKALIFHSFNQEGLFPKDLAFYREYNRFYMPHVKNLDCLGLVYEPAFMEWEILSYYDLGQAHTHYVNQEPDRSCPSNDENCYLKYFRNKKILIICPFAGLLKERATEEVFEGVWSKTGKRWFYPSEVDAIEFPYGFARTTQEKHGSALQLFEHITDEIDRRTFDIALIAAAGLAIPLASYVKSIGKVGIDLGGHLQILFGVIGKRWRNWENWRRDYFNEWWIDMPEKYKPEETDVCDRGAYW